MAENRLRTLTARAVARISPAFAIGLLILLILAVALTLRLGNPLGRATGVDRFQHQVQIGRLELASTDAHPHMDTLAHWSADYLDSITRSLGLPQAPITIRLLSNKRAFQRYGQEHILGFTRRMDFCYYPTDRCVYGYFMSMRELRPRLQHELLHAVLHNSRSDLPLWFEEGLAELSEDFIFADGRLQLDGIQRRRMQLARKYAKRDQLPSPNDLSQLGPRRFYGRQAALYYSASYSVVLLLHQQSRLEQTLQSGQASVDVANYLRFVQDSGAWDEPQAIAPAGVQVAKRVWVFKTGVLGNANL